MWSIHTEAPELSELLEPHRPLRERTLSLAREEIHLLSALKACTRGLSSRDAFALIAEGVSEIEMAWPSAVLEGIAALLRRRIISATTAYRTLCLAASACLKRNESEPFRLLLSFITRAGLQPREEATPQMWGVLATSSCPLEVYAHKLEKNDCKGAPVVACLLFGLAQKKRRGDLSAEDCRRIVKMDVYRASSPLRDLLFPAEALC